MKLSEAILKGTEIAPFQCTGQLFDSRITGVHACVLGAALIGSKGLGKLSDLSPSDMDDLIYNKTFEGYQKLEKHFPELSGKSVNSLPSPNFKATLLQQIVHCNDELQMPRERIATRLAEAGL